jgi:ribonuclease G
MHRELIINSRPYETRVALIENALVVEVFNQRASDQEILGNIYRGKVTRVLPGMQAAFVEIGLERTAFLYVSDVLDNLIDMGAPFFEDEMMEAYPEGSEPGSLIPSKSNGVSAQIEDLLREGQHILVQACKEPIGDKGARLTSHLSIPGRYLVLLPTVDHIGISRLIENKDKRERLKEIIREIKPANSGFIARTVSEDAPRDVLQSEMDFLLKMWSGIRKKMERQTKPGLLYRDLPISLRAVRDLFSKEVDRLVVDSKDDYEKITEFVQNVAPELKQAVAHYDGAISVFEYFGIEKEISRALDPKVMLKSGAYIIIERTEAFTSIDVNTGSYVGDTSLEETILKTNLEAAKEIAHQLRFRNIGGLIVIDFISMEQKRHGEEVCAALKTALTRDKARTNVLPMSDLGLIEMTRKRTRPSLNRLLTEPCAYCGGKGRLKSKKEICNELFRGIERENVVSGADGDIFLSVNPLIGIILKEDEYSALMALEKKLGKRIHVAAKENLHLEQYKIYR